MTFFFADLLAVIRQSALLLLGLMPYVVAGALLGALLVRYRETLVPRRWLTAPAWLLIPLSAVIGTISPLCTMGTVPVVMGLIACGLPPGAGIAFLAASSLVNPQMLLIACGTIGSMLALAQWLTGIGLACTAGGLAVCCERFGVSAVHPNLAQADTKAPAKEPGCHHKRHQKKTYFSAFLDQLEHVLLYVVFGVFLASMAGVWLPEGFVPRMVGLSEAASVAAGALVSAPLYVCGGGTLPALGELMQQGLPGGVVLAFIVAGPATRIQALAAVAVVLNKKASAGYIILIWLWAFAAGMLFNALFA